MNLRTVTEELAVSDVIYAESKIYPRAEDAFDALKWWLAHKPDSGTPLDEKHWVYKQNGDHLKNVPSLVVLYTYNDNEVQILRLLVKLPSL